jgi:large subunit ribosomal protein L23
MINKDIKDIIIKPIITEKTTGLKGQNKYVFEVAKDANKLQIKQAIEELFNVKVIKVNTFNKKGKPRRVRFRQPGKRKDIKKAIVTLKEGQTIPLFEV